MSVMPEFVSRVTRLKGMNPYRTNYALISKDTDESYRYIRVAKIHNDFPVGTYSEPGTVAFMRPETLDIAMPPAEKRPYGSGDHVLWHETEHVFAEIDKRPHDEGGFNARAVEGLRQKTGYDVFPFPSYAYN